MSEDIKLTVYFSTYNQEEYVAQALDSMIMQKTDFKYKILAADDCSTDNTQKIILDYQNRYPDLIETYFTSVNVGGCQKLADCIDKGLLEGEFIALLEGDDYWLDESRLQILVDFLEKNPVYSRVSHKRMVINEKDEKVGYDTARNVLNKAFYIEDLLEGKLYSDFGSIFRNYYKEAGNKYHPLLLASRNVCDFQDMFITQDFGPVFVMDKCFGVYRSRSIAGATNYNSITSQKKRCMENIKLAKTVEEFYKGKYDLTPMIRHNQKRLLSEAIKNKDKALMQEVRDYIGTDTIKELLPEQLYLIIRGSRKEEKSFILANTTVEERKGLYPSLVWYFFHRIKNKVAKTKVNEKLRGTVNVQAND